ncbi:hypothetical protein J3R82DRAFT_4838 [Butyriboletus roseoflavus]|nr:hypothetical protein J3R82DRAFT_4838 [Butyriboletus roseoflavus]
MRKTLLVAVPGITMAQVLQAPYAVPIFASVSSNSWPHDSNWTSLNDSVGGHLQVLRPWAAVCYTSDPFYNPEECQSVLLGYRNDTQACFNMYCREAAPAALLWPNWESCSYSQGCALNYTNPQPIGGAACYQGSTPPYSVSILDAQDASIVIKWAIAHNVKLTVRNTGHDYQGRSAAPSTLQVNTHLLDNLSYVPEFIPQGLNTAPVPALTMGAGAQIYNIYNYAAAQNFSPVIGACLTVGAAGGFLQGGGHGVLTPAYGLAVDSALEFEVVTADGQIRVANEAQNPDLFWALRGGGAGSWGIVISATIQVYPSVAVGASLLTILPSTSQNVTTLGIEFISFVAKYQNAWINKGIPSSLIMFQDQYSLSLYWPATTANLSDLYSFFEELKSLSSNYTVTSNTTSASMFPTVSAANEQGIGPVFDALNLYGASNQLASRLVPQSYIDPSNPSSITAVSEAIWNGLQIVNGPLESNATGLFGTVPVLILGNMPAATSTLVNETGANPGLYSAAWHVVYAAPWTLGVNATTTAEVITAIHNAVSPLTALGIKSSYQNEGDAFEEDWQEAFFGYKYAELSSIKQKYDPKNCELILGLL